MVLLDPLTVPKFVNTLDGNALALGSPDFVYHPKGTAYVTLQDGSQAWTPLYNVGAYQIQQDLGLGLKDANDHPLKTTVYGYGPSAATATYPGRTFNVQSDQAIAVQWANGLTGQTHLLPNDSTVLGPNADREGNPFYTVTTGPTGVQSVNYTSGIPITPHLHGGHTTASYDGTPKQWLTATGPNQQVGPDFVGNPYVYDNTQQAATIWYHDHTAGITRLNVEAGLAGFYVIHDSNENKLIAQHRLPDERYDVPLAIQDRMFYGPGTTDDPATPWVEAPGQLYYPADVLPGTTAPYPSIHPNFYGDAILVNGLAWPVMHVEPRMYRFRLLDGSNSRFYNLRFSIQNQDPNQPSDQTFFQVGTDDGLLKKPVPLGQVLIAPGERADVVVDFSQLAGKTLIVTNDANTPFPPGKAPDPRTTGRIMAFQVDTPLNREIPDAYRFSTTATMNTTIVPFGHADNTRELALGVTKDQYGRNLLQLGTPAGGLTPFDVEYASITERIRLGNIERWVIYNNTDHTHPMHLHQVAFQVISRQAFTADVNPATGVMTNIKLQGRPRGPDANEAGWKDTARMNPGEVTILEARFDLPGKYVWHCHILEHEEHDMMHYFVVEPRPANHGLAAARLVASPDSKAPASPVDATALPTITSTTQTVAPGIRTEAPNSAVTDATIALHYGQIGSLLNTDGESPVDPLEADILRPSRKKRR
ncbi:MAG: multicopper oxidase domain-containing protein [Gemmataceae bacterium]